MRLSSQNLSTLLMWAKTKVSHLSYQVQCSGLFYISWGALPNQPESLETGTTGTEISREHFQKMRKLLVVGKGIHYFQPKNSTDSGRKVKRNSNSGWKIS